MFFDDDDDSFSPRESKPSKPSKPSKLSRKEMIKSHLGDSSMQTQIFKEEFGIQGWKLKHFIILIVVILVLAAVVFIKFGGSLQNVTDNIKGNMGQKETAKVIYISHKGNLLKVKLEQTETTRLIGIAPPTKCSSKYLNNFMNEHIKKGQKTTLVFDLNAGKYNEQNEPQTYLTVKNQNLNLLMIEQGAAKIDLNSLERSKKKDLFIKKEKTAKQKNKGLWQKC